MYMTTTSMKKNGHPNHMLSLQETPNSVGQATLCVGPHTRTSDQDIEEKFTKALKSDLLYVHGGYCRTFI